MGGAEEAASGVMIKLGRPDLHQRTVESRIFRPVARVAVPIASTCRPGRLVPDCPGSVGPAARRTRRHWFWRPIGRVEVEIG